VHFLLFLVIFLELSTEQFVELSHFWTSNMA